MGLPHKMIAPAAVYNSMVNSDLVEHTNILSWWFGTLEDLKGCSTVWLVLDQEITVEQMETTSQLKLEGGN